MRHSLLLLTATAVLAAAGAASAAPTVEVKDAVARVTVIPESRSDVKIEIVASNPKLPLQMRSFGGRTIVDGDLDHKIRECHGTGEHASVHVRGVGDVSWADMPQIVVRTPRDVDIDTGGAVWGTVGRSASLNLGNAGCGDWTGRGARRCSRPSSTIGWPPTLVGRALCYRRRRRGRCSTEHRPGRSPNAIVRNVMAVGRC